MSAQPEAMRLADALEMSSILRVRLQAAAELRRLSAENERLHQINQSHEMKLSVRGYEIQIADLEAQRDALLERADTLQRWYDQQLDRLAAVEAQRDALLEALQALYDEQQGPPLIRHQAAWEAAMEKARAAIKKAEGENT